jgi:hypothetical protein
MSHQGKRKAQTPPPEKRHSPPPDSPDSLFSGGDSPLLSKINASSSSKKSADLAKSISTSKTEGKKNSRGIKLLDIPHNNAASGSSLSTKQRITQGLKAASSPKSEQLAPPPRVNSLSSLSFKKHSKPSTSGALADQNAPTEPLAVQTQQESEPSSTTPSTRPQPSPVTELFSDNIAFPVDMDTIDYESFGPISGEAGTTFVLCVLFSMLDSFFLVQEYIHSLSPAIP